MRRLRMRDPKQARQNKEGRRTVENEGVDEEVCAAKEQERERQMSIWMKNHKNSKTDK